MTTQIQISNKTINESLIDGNNVIYIVKYEGKRESFYTLISAQPDSSIHKLIDKLSLKDSNKGAAAFWTPRAGECIYKCTNIPAFNQCFNERLEGYANLIIDEFKF